MFLKLVNLGMKVGKKLYNAYMHYKSCGISCYLHIFLW